MSLYKFTLDQDYIFDLSPFTLISHNIQKPWMRIEGTKLIIPAGYSWDGCSPKFKIGNKIFGTPDFEEKTKYASLVHDVLYQYFDVVSVRLVYESMIDRNISSCDVEGLTLDEVKNNPARKFIVATETGIFHQMKKSRADVELIQAPVIDEACACNDCPYMKMNTLAKIKSALESFQPEVHLNEQLREKAFTSLDRMMKITSGTAVTWPETFTYSASKF